MPSGKTSAIRPPGTIKSMHLSTKRF